MNPTIEAMKDQMRAELADAGCTCGTTLEFRLLPCLPHGGLGVFIKHGDRCPVYVKLQRVKKAQWN